MFDPVAAMHTKTLLNSVADAITSEIKIQDGQKGLSPTQQRIMNINPTNSVMPADTFLNSVAATIAEEIKIQDGQKGLSPIQQRIVEGLETCSLGAGLNVVA